MCTNMCCSLCVVVCVSGGLLYVVFQELFSSSSPNKIYGKAFNKVRLDPEVRLRSQVAEAKQCLCLKATSPPTVHDYCAMLC